MFKVNFKHIQHINQIFLLFTVNMHLFPLFVLHKLFFFKLFWKTLEISFVKNMFSKVTFSRLHIWWKINSSTSILLTSFQNLRSFSPKTVFVNYFFSYSSVWWSWCWLRGYLRVRCNRMSWKCHRSHMPVRYWITNGTRVRWSIMCSR